MARSRSSTVALTRLLHDCSTPIYVLDRHHEYIFANESCHAWLGHDFGEILGLRGEYHNQDVAQVAQSIANALCPPPETFSGKSQTATISCPRSDGTTSLRQAQFVALGAGDEQAGAMVIVESEEQTDTGERESFELTSQELHSRLATIRSALAHVYDYDRLIGESPAIERVRRQVDLAAGSSASVLVSGAPGTGREHIARTIYYGRQPTDSLLLPIDCSLQTPESIQASLTSLVREQTDHQPKIPGTLLLLEIDQLNAESQNELLGLLQLPNLNLLLLSTSSIGAGELAEHREFATDLLYHLSAIDIRLPPLAERREDIPLLAQYFLEEVNAEGNRQWSGLTTDAMEELVAYPLPHNIDQLRAVIRSACERSQGQTIQLTELPEEVHLARHPDARGQREEESIDLDRYLAKIEEELIQRALRKAKGNKTKAAQLLGLTRARLHRRITDKKL